MSKISKPVADRSKENVVAALDAAENAVQAMAKGIATAKRRIEELEEALAQSEQAREDAEARAVTLEDKLRKVQATLA